MLLLWISEIFRGSGLWKFNNILLKDDDYVNMIYEIYFRIRVFYNNLEDKRFFWEMLKMEMRALIISYSKNKVKLINIRESKIS